VAPYADSGEEVVLVESPEVAVIDFDNASFIDFPWCDMACGYEVAQPLRGERVYFVVVGGHGCFTNCSTRCREML